MAHLLAKQRKSFTDSELTKSYLIAAVEEMYLENRNIYETISLLLRIIAQKVENLDSNFNSQLKIR